MEGFQVIFGVKTGDVEWRFLLTPCVCFVSVWDQGYPL